MKILKDSAALAAYSADASLFQVTPRKVAIPEKKEDLVALIKEGKPLIPRGGATGTTGGCLGEGTVVDMSVHLNKVLHLDLKKQQVTVEPGIVLETLNQFLRPHGLKVGPDTSTANRATIGGMVANNTAGASSLLYGTTADAIEGISLLLSTGEETRLLSNNSLTEQLKLLGEENRELIQRHFPPIPRRVSGYALDTLLKNPLKIVAGSEGTLGIITEVTLSLVPISTELPLFIYCFPHLQDAFKAIPEILKTTPSLLELMDKKVLGDAIYLPGAAFLLVEWLSLPTFPFPPYASVTGMERKKILEVRRSGLEHLFSRRSYEGPCGFLEDVAVPPEQLPAFMEKFLPLMESRFGETAVYGHAGAGCLHIRPFVDLRVSGKVDLVLETMREATALLRNAGGVLSGEHGDGLLRSWLNPELFGEEIIDLFRKVKKLFDPTGIMNPGKILPSPFPKEHLKKTLPLGGDEPQTFLDFSKEGGLTLAADLCNGNGLCRKKGGFMCPSFQATGEEVDAPRGRAQAIRNAIHNEDLGDNDLQTVLNRCLMCKGCQLECPSAVDISKMKAETLFHHHQKFGIPLRSRLIGHLPDLLPYLPSWLFSLKAKTPFSKRKRKSTGGEKVALFIDTFTEWFEPEVGEAASRVLEFFGFEVEPITGFCCGRTAYSKGMLPLAKKKLSALRDEVLRKKIPVIGIEPSCVAMAQDEAKGLLGEAIPLLSFERFLERVSLKKRESGELLLHVHCHQKASPDAKLPLAILKQIVGNQIEEIPSGCCGMAGSFGYEREHAKLSKEVANLVLVPSIKQNEEALVVATGFSCRTQVKRCTDKKAVSLPSLLCDLYNLNSRGV